jgi:hypothetical protein
MPIDDWPTSRELTSEEHSIVFLDSGSVPARYPYILPQHRDRQRQAQKTRMRYRQTQTPRRNLYMTNANAKSSADGDFGRKPLWSLSSVCLNRFDRAVGVPATVPGVTPVAVEIVQHAKTRRKLKGYPDVVWLNFTTCRLVYLRRRGD